MSTLPAISPHPHWTADEIFIPPLKLVYGHTERNFSAGIHIQDFYEINIVLNGNGVHYIGENKINVSRGDVFIVPPYVRHAYEGGDGFDVYHLLLSPQYLEKYSADLQLLPAYRSLFTIEPFMREKTNERLYLRLTDKEFSYLYPYFDSIAYYSESPSIENSIVCNSKALILITRICVYYHRDMQSNGFSETESKAFLNSISYIYEKYYENITIETLSRIAQMSRSAYISKFRQICGASPGEFILSHRINLAKAMLTETNRSISDITQALGFYDSAHFTRIFKTRVGLTPSAFRKRNKK
ncbi:MAG: AraC family transcriptional regulator [Clostridia bacterium]|nr:AraC family transcriptional regulator [Clostridia bacterium]